MTIADHLKSRVEPTRETSCISNIPQTMDNTQHSVPISWSWFTVHWITLVYSNRSDDKIIIHGVGQIGGIHSQAGEFSFWPSTRTVSSSFSYLEHRATRSLLNTPARCDRSKAPAPLWCFIRTAAKPFLLRFSTCEPGLHEAGSVLRIW
jgi:hypothetical protein